MTRELADYTSLVRQTVKTLTEAKTITPSMKQQAIRFYHWLGEFLPEVNQETKFKYKKYEALLREKGILKW